VNLAERELGLPAADGLVPAWSGLLLVDKPVGVTSHDVVARVRRRMKDRGAGHLGTLDPGASGLLVVALGAATRCIQVWQGGEKTYEARIRFGVVTDTQDLQGVIVEQSGVVPDEAAIRAASAAFSGEIDQIPPMVSALKVNGERLHRIARRGETVERQPRRVRVVSWEWTSFAGDEASCVVRVSGGTYVRTLAHDLGAALGTGAALAALRRVRSEPFSVERAIGMRVLDTVAREEALASAGIGLDEALNTLPAVRLEEADATQLGFGGQPRIRTGEGGADPAAVGRGPRSVVARDATGRALALGQLNDGGAPGAAVLRPNVVFPWAVRRGRAEAGGSE
jgi:tRNA pseudouridine55 synthase